MVRHDCETVRHLHARIAVLCNAVLAAAALWVVPVPAAAMDGGCAEQFFQSGYFLEDKKPVFDETRFYALATRMETPVYKNPEGGERAATTIGFSEKVRVSDPGTGVSRMRVRTLSDQDRGWVEREDLLCRVTPLSDAKTGLLRRIVVQTETAVQGQVVPRNAYHASSGQLCEGGPSNCPKLSRFQWYFAYGEQDGRVLLSDAGNLGAPAAQLLGWLPEGDGIYWNTAIAVRPALGLEARKGPDGASESHVCAFPTLEAVKNPSACRPILGGRRWFNTDVRMPVLRDLGNVYEVAVSGAAVSGSFDDAVSLVGVDALKNVDVFFVIDGTTSMQYAIDAIKGRPGSPGIVDQIRDRIRGKARQGGTVRYGYRVYRDSVKGGATGVEDDGLPLGNDCGANDAEFVSKFQTVGAYDSPGDEDYPENVFGGLIQAGRDFASCPDHLKLVVVIGDHGYDPNAQRQRGHKVYDVDAVAARFVRGARLKTQPIVIFIQGPNEAASFRNSETYQKSYSEFEAQGLAILRKIYGSFRTAGIEATVDPAEFYFRMPSRTADTDMIDRIISRVDQLMQPDVVAKLASRLKSGESLIDAITALQRGDRTNVPILYWNVIADALCQRLGSQCTKQVLEGVFPAYIPGSGDLTFDVLLSQRQLEDWREILGKFDTFWMSLRGGERSRDQIVNTLVESIGSVLKLNIDDSGKTIGEFVQLAGGLPHGTASRLMAYTPDDLRDARRVETCEIQHIVNYAGKKAKIIPIVLDGDKLASVTEEALPLSACPTLTAKGKGVPLLPGVPTPQALNDPSANTRYRLKFSKGNDVYYWVPMEYMP